MQRILAFVLTFVLFACRLSGIDAADSKKTPEQQRIGVIVELLASRNSAPEHTDWKGFPADYDKNAQVVVYLAIQQLLNEGSAAFDVLIEHLNDKRYSYTLAEPSGNDNCTVGEVCDLIIFQSVKCYDAKISIITTDQFHLDPALENMADWWKRNRERPLWQIQVEAIDKAISFMETVDREKAAPGFPPGHRLPPARFGAARKNNLKILKELRASIEARKEAYQPKSLNGRLDEMIGLPWPTNRFGE